jgi:hypothetical protein
VVVPPSHGAGPHTTVWKLVKELNTLGAKFNLSDSIWFWLKDARDRYDAMMERIMKEHEEARKKMKETSDEDVTVKDLLDIFTGHI